MLPRVLALYHRAETFGGSFNSVLDVLGTLSRERFEVVAGVPGPGNCAQAFARLGLQTVFAEEQAGSRRPTYAASVAQWAWRLRRRKVNLVYVSDYVTWRSSALLAARLLGLPRVVHVRAPLPEVGLDPELLKATVVLGNSRATVSPLMRPPASQDVRAIYNFIDFARFDLATDRRAELMPGDGPIVGFVGVFRPEKGIEYFLEMARLLTERRKDVRFLLVGGESAVADVGWFPRMRELAAALGLADRTLFTGSRTDIADLMKSMDVLVVPSLNEGFGRVIVEANAVGVPVVGANAAGIPEVIEEGLTGFLVAPRDPHGMADTVNRILDDPAWRAKVAAFAPARVRDRFSRATQMQLFERALLDALSR
jgi:glycosyltransferase involved in cell wall biosynthesis